jgi:hypothetical protein
VESSCELGNEPLGSIKMLGIYRVAAQFAASRVVLSSTELVRFAVFTVVATVYTGMWFTEKSIAVPQKHTAIVIACHLLSCSAYFVTI